MKPNRAYVVSHNGNLLSDIFNDIPEFKAKLPREAYVYDDVGVAVEIALECNAIVKPVYKINYPFGDWVFYKHGDSNETNNIS